MTTNSTTRRKPPAAATKTRTAEEQAVYDETVETTRRVLAEAREATGMQEIYDAVDEAVGVPDLKRRMLRRRLDGREVPIEGLGTLMIRGLSQVEIKVVKAGAAEMAAQPDAPADQDTLFEWLLVSTALLEPRLTPEEVGQFFANAPAGEALEVMSAVQRLSGMDKGSAKSGLPAV